MGMAETWTKVSQLIPIIPFSLALTPPWGLHLHCSMQAVMLTVLGRHPSVGVGWTSFSIFSEVSSLFYGYSLSLSLFSLSLSFSILYSLYSIDSIDSILYYILWVFSFSGFHISSGRLWCILSALAAAPGDTVTASQSAIGENPKKIVWEIKLRNHYVTNSDCFEI